MASLVQRLREQVFGRVSGSNFTTTNNTATTVTGLTFNIGANEEWVIDVALTTQCSSTGGVKYAISVPATASVEGWIQTSTSALTTLSFQRFTSTGLTSTAAHTVATTPGPDVMRVWVKSTGGGTVAIQVASGTSGQTTTVFIGSFMKAQRVA